MARKIGSTELQTALYAKLNGVISCSVYDDVPENKTYPYAVIAEDFSNPYNDTKTNYSRSIRTTINIWSEYRGKKEVKAIADEIAALLDTSLTVSGFQVLQVEHEASFNREEDRYRGIIDITVLMKQA